METISGLVKIDNANIYYELAGGGQPLVMIHAGVADSRQWNNEFVSFARDFRVLRYDMRGFGKSLPAAGDYTNMADLVGLLDQLNFQEPIILIGCSMGGGLALDFALEFPSKVRALIMVGSGPTGLSLDVADHPKAVEAEQAYEAGDLDLLAELEAQIWFDGLGRTALQVDPEKRKLAVEMNRLALAHDAQKLGRRLPDSASPAAERLDELNTPLLLLVGQYDIPYSHAAADYMVASVPSGQKIILEDAAHLPNMEHPAQFEAAVHSFLDDPLI